MSVKFAVIKKYDKMIGRGLTREVAQDLLRSVQRTHPEARIVTDNELDRLYGKEDRELTDRMDGLVLQSCMTAILRNAEEIIHDLEQEGFEQHDAIEYICDRIRKEAIYA